eukprot:CAMPEP_0206593806 /NCGR_PEP_ID=MMETSP0325_2-20121206/41917_1 /ASSEMBLY_ACC=CAM_ASM_000347 /TAXON_ID=2866 /ORGANISM="Crypthecodinium cohnii, Strain Seligo" /LENGTH=301 /DNA_ID=CAMNT_0054103985 /DNA_START=332 /DNA_END=1238 /DNA_ORIENTATION=+
MSGGGSSSNNRSINVNNNNSNNTNNSNNVNSNSNNNNNFVSTAPSLARRLSKREERPDEGNECLGPGTEQARALLMGCKVRRAIASKSVQNKLRLRHDLYLLITDAEQEKSEVSYRAAWVESLYASLAKAQAECLAELNICLNGPLLVSGFQNRSKSAWRGWTKNLERMIGYRKLSQTPPERSLVGSTSLRAAPDLSQVLKKRRVGGGLAPISPGLDSDFGELRSQSFALTGSFEGFGELEGELPDHSLTVSITPTRAASECTPGMPFDRLSGTPVDFSPVFATGGYDCRTMCDQPTTQSQ